MLFLCLALGVYLKMDNECKSIEAAGRTSDISQMNFPTRDHKHGLFFFTTSTLTLDTTIFEERTCQYHQTLLSCLHSTQSPPLQSPQFHTRCHPCATPPHAPRTANAPNRNPGKNGASLEKKKDYSLRARRLQPQEAQAREPRAEGTGSSPGGIRVWGW